MKEESDVTCHDLTSAVTFPVTDSPSSTSTTAARSRDKPFMCKVCSRRFGYKHVLLNHERTHTGEKPFECVECGKRFTRDHHLKTHVRLHTGEKPYGCPRCDRRFVQVANLRRHVRVHMFECRDCGVRFSNDRQLTEHAPSHGGLEPFECDGCRRRFRRRQQLLFHGCSAASAPSVGNGRSNKASSDRDEAAVKARIKSRRKSQRVVRILPMSRSTGSFLSGDVEQTNPLNLSLSPGHQAPLSVLRSYLKHGVTRPATNDEVLDLRIRRGADPEAVKEGGLENGNGNVIVKQSSGQPMSSGQT